MLALATGRLDDAEELIPQALALGERALPEAAIPIYHVQRYTLADFRGNLEEVEPAIRTVVADHPTRPVFRCALAHIHARLGRRPEAQRALDDLTRDDCWALPFDQEWLYAMSLLAETSALLGNVDASAILARLLGPWAMFNAADTGEGMRGSVARYLGLAAMTSRSWDEAERHFAIALERNAAMGARPWLAHTSNDYARMLLARDDSGDRERAHELIADALAIYRELGMAGWAQAASDLRRTPPRPARPVP